MLNKNKILIAGIVGGVLVAVPNVSQSAYQCLPCPENSFVKKGTVGTIDSCVHLLDMKDDFFSKKYSASVGSCVTGSVKQGYPYKVKLGGGAGGKSGFVKDQYNIPGAGAVLENNFIAPFSGNFILCAGKKGGDAVCDSAGGAGGQGSFLYIYKLHTELIFAAGGGGGVVGAVGKGANGGCFYKNAHQIEEDGTQCSLFKDDCSGVGGDVLPLMFNREEAKGGPGTVLFSIGYVTGGWNSFVNGNGYAELYSLE